MYTYSITKYNIS